MIGKRAIIAAIVLFWLVCGALGVVAELAWRTAKGSPPPRLCDKESREMNRACAFCGNSRQEDRSGCDRPACLRALKKVVECLEGVEGRR